VSEPRTIDDLVLSPAGEEARELARLAILDGRPLDVEPVPEPPKPKPVPEHVRKRRERHDREMGRVFGRVNGDASASRLRGRLLGIPPEWLVDLLHDENEAAPDLCLPVLPEPEVRDGEILWGRSATRRSGPRLDPECAFEPRDVPARPIVDGVAADVAPWLEILGEPLTAQDLADVTGHGVVEVFAALTRMREAGLVARQQTGGGPLWVWRRWRR
jgi:hypothetical protein